MVNGNQDVTRPAHKPLGSAKLTAMAKLMQIHHATHPDRVGRLFGVTSTYVRAVWSRTPADHQASLEELAKCEELRELIRQGVIAPGPNRDPVNYDPMDQWERSVAEIYEKERRHGK